jgi:hypothetical protein
MVSIAIRRAGILDKEMNLLKFIQPACGPARLGLGAAGGD